MGICDSTLLCVLWIRSVNQKFIQKYQTSRCSYMQTFSCLYDQNQKNVKSGQIALGKYSLSVA